MGIAKRHCATLCGMISWWQKDLIPGRNVLATWLVPFSGCRHALQRWPRRMSDIAMGPDNNDWCDDHCDGNHACCHHIVLFTPSLWLPELYSPLRLYGGAHCQRRRRGQWDASQGWGTTPLPSSSPLSSLSFSTSTIISMIVCHHNVKETCNSTWWREQCPACSWLDSPPF